MCEGAGQPRLRSSTGQELAAPNPQALLWGGVNGLMAVLEKKDGGSRPDLYWSLSWPGQWHLKLGPPTVRACVSVCLCEWAHVEGVGKCAGVQVCRHTCLYNLGLLQPPVPVSLLPKPRQSHDRDPALEGDMAISGPGLLPVAAPGCAVVCASSGVGGLLLPLPRAAQLPLLAPKPPTVDRSLAAAEKLQGGSFFTSLSSLFFSVKSVASAHSGKHPAGSRHTAVG